RGPFGAQGRRSTRQRKPGTTRERLRNSAWGRRVAGSAEPRVLRELSWMRPSRVLHRSSTGSALIAAFSAPNVQSSAHHAPSLVPQAGPEPSLELGCTLLSEGPSASANARESHLRRV